MTLYLVLVLGLLIEVLPHGRKEPSRLHRFPQAHGIVVLEPPLAKVDDPEGPVAVGEVHGHKEEIVVPACDVHPFPSKLPLGRPPSHAVIAGEELAEEEGTQENAGGDPGVLGPVVLAEGEVAEREESDVDDNVVEPLGVVQKVQRGNRHPQLVPRSGYMVFRLGNGRGMRVGGGEREEIQYIYFMNIRAVFAMC